MTREELIETFGTIAHSGSKPFLQQIRENAGNPSLNGQFGVEFYSAFIVGAQVTVYTRSYKPEETDWIWSSDGVNSYDIEPGLDLPRGTKVLINLKEADREFARTHRVEAIIKRYSNFVGFPIKSELTATDNEEFCKYTGHDVEPPLYRFHFSADGAFGDQCPPVRPKKQHRKVGHVEDRVRSASLLPKNSHPIKIERLAP